MFRSTQGALYRKRIARFPCAGNLNEVIPAEPLMPVYGWQQGHLPKYNAMNEFDRHKKMARMLTELIRKDFVIVNGAKAPALRAVADQAVSLAKKGDTRSRQHMAYFLQDPMMVDKAFDEFPRRFKDYHGSYTMMIRLREHRERDHTRLTFVEFKNREMSDSHKGEDFCKGPERFFLPPRVLETERGIQRPPHSQMAFDRWASKFKTEDFHEWWQLRHAKLRYWGYRQVPHPQDVEPLWSEKEEEEWHNEMLATTDVDIDLDDDQHEATGEVTK